MKKIIFGLVFLAFNTSMATSILMPDYVCQGENGLQYNFYTSSFSEIQIFDKNGNDKGVIDSISFNILQLESDPPQISVVAVDEDGETVAGLSYVEGSRVATGSIVDFINEEGSVNISCEL